jgi:hypothetical protein
MNIQKTIISAAAVAGMLGGVVATSGAASASTGRVVAYNTKYTGEWPPYATFPTPWSHPAAHPQALLSDGYSIWGARHLSWTSWGARSAHGNGQAFGYFVSESHLTTYRASVSLWDVKSHHGLRYFAKLKISAHGHKTIRLTIRSGSWA